MKKDEIKWNDPAKDIFTKAEIIKTISAKDLNASMQKAEEHRIKAEKEEKEKINSRPVTCPVCKHVDRFDKFYHSIDQDNDVCGPGYMSWSILEYLSCPHCGIMFKDLRKDK